MVISSLVLGRAFSVQAGTNILHMTEVEQNLFHPICHRRVANSSCWYQLLQFQEHTDDSRIPSFWKLWRKLPCLPWLSRILLSAHHLHRFVNAQNSSVFKDINIIAPLKGIQTISGLYICKYQAKIYFIIVSESFPDQHFNFPLHWQEIDLLNYFQITIFSNDYDCFYPPFKARRTSKIIFAPASSLQSLRRRVTQSGRWLALSRDVCLCSTEWCHILYLRNTFSQSLTKNWRRSDSLNLSLGLSLPTSIYDHRRMLIMNVPWYFSPASVLLVSISNF